MMSGLSPEAVGQVQATDPGAGGCTLPGWPPRLKQAGCGLGWPVAWCKPVFVGRHWAAPGVR